MRAPRSRAFEFRATAAAARSYCCDWCCQAQPHRFALFVSKTRRNGAGASAGVSLVRMLAVSGNEEPARARERASDAETCARMWLLAHASAERESKTM